MHSLAEVSAEACDRGRVRRRRIPERPKFVSECRSGKENVARIVIRLPRPVRRRLGRLAQRTRDAQLRTRIQIVLLYHEGWGSPRISEALRCAPATAVRVAHRFQETGEAGLEDGRKENGSSKVDADLLQGLHEIVVRSPEDFGWSRPTWTREALVKTLARETGVRVSLSTMSRMLGGLQMRWGTARAIVLCPWSKRRKQWRLAQIRRVLAALLPDEVAYYQDEVDIHLNPKIGRDWMPKGKQKVVVTPGRNQKRYLSGALSVDGSELVYVTGHRKNTDLFLAQLSALKKRHPRARRIHLVLDNYTIHSSKRTRRYIAEHGELFQLHFLPPYTPEENHIERLWGDLHANVTRNHRCKKIDDLLDRVHEYMRVERARRRARSRGSRARRAG